MSNRRAARRAVLILLAPAATLSAQSLLPHTTPNVPRTFVGGGLLIAQPLGQLAQNVDVGIGFGGGISHQLDRRGIISWRGDVDYLVYGRERKRIPFNQNVGRVQLDLTTTNNILAFSTGPELAVQSGPVRPYAGASGGFSYFFTQSSLNGTSDQSPFAQTENYHNAKLSYGFNGGVLIPLAVKSVPLSIDLGAHFFNNGRVRYLTPGDVVDDGNGGVIITPRETQGNLILYRIGVRVGLASRGATGR